MSSINLNALNFIKVSVIVPCYNTRPWLDECLQSLVDQTLHEIEIICVNDGSTDDTGKKLDEWQKQYPNKIKVIHQANGGVSNARNAGMAIAQGECIGFVDSDDFVAVCMYEKLYNVLKNNNADVVKSNYIELIKKKDICIANDSYDNTISKSDMLHNSVTCCDALFSKVFLDQYKIKFCPNILYEDQAFHSELLFYEPNYYNINKPLYFYRKQRIGQITSLNGKEYYDIFKVFSYLEKKFKNNKNLVVRKFICRIKIVVFFTTYKKISKQYKNNFLFTAAKEFFSQDSAINIYKKTLFHKYKHPKSYVLALLALLFLQSLYLLQKLPFVKIKDYR